MSVICPNRAAVPGISRLHERLEQSVISAFAYIYKHITMQMNAFYISKRRFSVELWMCSTAGNPFGIHDGPVPCTYKRFRQFSLLIV